MRMMIRYWLLGLVLMVCFRAWGQDYEERVRAMDVRHYDFALTIHDSTDRIDGVATVRVNLLQPTQSIHLDLVGPADGQGMAVVEVKSGGKALEFQQTAEMLAVSLEAEAAANTELSLEIKYGGVPADGLIISKSERDGRSFFGDNWPNRAHHWLPVVDHPSDKAPVSWAVTAPAHYQIVANGHLVEQRVLPNGTQISRWDNPQPLPTKVMVIGAADFAVQNSGSVGDIKVSTWVFQKDEKPGFSDYAQGVKILEWFVKQVGPYPWDKLANVQSRTRYGGMENASCIFYADNSVTGDGSCEALMAHEIAHQWFGNSASEASWYHIWLSEGFATYLTHVYFEQVHGIDALRKRMQEDRNQIRAWKPTYSLALVDNRYKDLNQLLNTNSYQKGGWMLHMLRQQVGDENFFQGLRTYHARFKYSNALTGDLQKVMEEVSGQNLEPFFQQWVFRAGHPVIARSWKVKKSKKLLEYTITQKQEGPAFVFPIELAIFDSEGVEFQRERLEVTSKVQKFSIQLKGACAGLELDPDFKLLYSDGEGGK